MEPASKSLEYHHYDYVTRPDLPSPRKPTHSGSSDSNGYDLPIPINQPGPIYQSLQVIDKSTRKQSRLKFMKYLVGVVSISALILIPIAFIVGSYFGGNTSYQAPTDLPTTPQVADDAHVKPAKQEKSTVCNMTSDTTLETVGIPPSITQQADPQYVYRSDSTVELPCEASGIPEPSYRWSKDGTELKLSRYVRLTTEGTLIVSPATSLDAGYYQCLAENPYGVAMSGVSLLSMAFLGSYPPDIPIRQYTVNVGDPLTIYCGPLPSAPRAKFSWALAKKSVDDSPVRLDVSQRLNIDIFGNLYFAHVRESDAQDQRLYKCNVYNADLDVSTGGSSTQIFVNPGSSEIRAPTIRFRTRSPHITLVGETMNIQCLFSGKPEPTVHWSRAVDPLPLGRYTTKSWGTQLEVSEIRESDEGVYICTGSNEAGSSSEEIQIIVEARPSLQFHSIDVRPVNVNKTEGDRVEFNCYSYAIPEATVTWLINGEVQTHLPERMVIINNGKTLVIDNLCKECPGSRSSDLMVVQCNSSNIHGYAFGEGYLNVLRPTILVEETEKQYEVNVDTILQLPCEGESDDSTPITHEWRFEDSKLYPEEPYTRVLCDNTLEIDTNGLGGDNWKKYAGKYTCVATNGYSRAKTDALVNLPDENRAEKISLSLRALTILVVALVI